MVSSVPKMVFAGEFWRGASGLGLAKGFRRLGWSVQEVDYQRFRGNFGASFSGRLAAKAGANKARQAYLDKLYDDCKLFRPDVFFTIKGAALDKAFLERIKALGIVTAIFYPDVVFDHSDHAGDITEMFDLFVTTKSYQIDLLTEKLGADRVVYVPHGYTSGVHVPIYPSVAGKDFQADLQYIGSQSDYKREWMEKLRALLPGPSMRVIGMGWPQAVAASPLRNDDVYDSRVGALYAEATQLGKVNISLHYGPVNGWEDLVSTRTFEIPASKGFMLHIDNDEVREFFEPGKEIDVFSTPDELADKAKFYLDRPELRTKMIERAYQRCVPHYSYDERVKPIDAALMRHVEMHGKDKT